MKKLMFAIALSVSLYAQSASEVQKLLAAEGEKLRALGKDPAIVAAVQAQNARKTPLAAIKATDERWTAGREEALGKKILAGPCADRLRAIVAANPAYSETFAMDDQGALVCATAKTSDYWQGDEAKWERAYDSGRGAVFIDRPKFDDSAKARIAQISVPVMDGQKAIGAVTIGVIIEKLQ